MIRRSFLTLLRLGLPLTGVFLTLSLFIASSFEARAQERVNPAGDRPQRLIRPRNTEPGWAPWRPIREQPSVSFDVGFSNTDLGGYAQFRNDCAEQTGQPPESFPNWFRISNLMYQIGTGLVEYGCWVNDRFIATFSATAIDTTLDYVDCLRVTPMRGSRLNIYSAPSTRQPIVGTVNRGRVVNPGGFPAVVVQAEGVNWVAISAPQEGWVIQGAPGRQGNLKLCDRQ